MTEEEARDKWCPQTFNAEAPDRCIASKCAVWVHEKAIWCNKDGSQPTESQLNERTPEDAGLITVSFGHCGLIR